ncbi:hypothetical protein [Streptomyces sp. MA15]|uniref:hypothetical protein n=1 Tax=Streptomyces sp. MA15 TaxID=3055061 RepID=UPI0025B0290D|nr:hypothetical protein [Streptomyces sp. MA15]MDN3271969.1 hypothetical protein [Streptomyces sp. MA15]
MREPGHVVRDDLYGRVDVLLDDLAVRVRIPSVSADPAHERDVSAASQTRCG